MASSQTNRGAIECRWPHRDDLPLSLPHTGGGTSVPRTRIPLAVKLTAYTALIVLITSAALSVAAYSPARDTLKNRVRDRLELVAADRREMLLGYLEQQRQLAAMIVKQLFYQSLLEKHLQGADEDLSAIGQRLLDGSQAIPPSFLELSIVDPLGTVFVASTDSSWLIGQSMSERPEFIHGREESYFTSSPHPEIVHLYLSTPMTDDDGQLLGVLLVLLDIRPLTALLDGDVGLGRTGQRSAGESGGRQRRVLAIFFRRRPTFEG